MKFEPLSQENIEEAIALVHSIFLEDAKAEDNPAKAYRASLKPSDYRDYWKKYELKTLEYWVVRAEDESPIIGATGLYRRSSDPAGMAWLGWYYVIPSERRKGYGREILEWTIERARAKGFNALRLYTSTDPSEAVAQELYEKMGFKIVLEAQRPGEDMTLYRERKL